MTTPARNRDLAARRRYRRGSWIL